MDKIEREFIVIAVHGEGDRATVNSLQQHRNDLETKRLMKANVKVPTKLRAVPDEAPDVIVVLRDPENPSFRLDWPVETWDEVEQWKNLAGYDSSLRHWMTGGRVKVNLGG